MSRLTSLPVRVVLAALLLAGIGFAVAATGHVGHPAPTQFPAHGVTLGGDVMLGRDIERKIFNGTNPFANVRPLFEASNATVVNLESPLTLSTQAQPKEITLKARPQSVALLQDADIGVAALANNHVMDYGVAGLTDTLAQLDQAGISHTGAGLDLAQATAPVFLQVQGERVAVVNFSQYDGPTVPAATPNQPGQASFRSPAFIPTLEYAAANSEYLIAVLHFGEEYRRIPTAEQETAARRAIDHGADLVIGHHPHVAQGVELYKGKPIFYSLGNLVFDQETELWDRSFLVALDLLPQAVEFTVYPYEIREGVPSFMSADDGTEFLSDINDLSATPHLTLSGGIATMSVSRPDAETTVPAAAELPGGTMSGEPTGNQ